VRSFLFSAFGKNFVDSDFSFWLSCQYFGSVAQHFGSNPEEVSKYFDALNDSLWTDELKHTYKSRLLSFIIETFYKLNHTKA